MKRLIKLEQTYKGKFIKTFLAHFQTENGLLKYEIASRKDKPDIISENKSADAVRILPYFKDKDGKIKVVLIKEFRYAINDYIYGVPAGLVEQGETPSQVAKRELLEEIGAETISLEQTEKKSYTSAGFSDESMVTFEAEVKLNHNQKLESTEDISIHVVDLDTLKTMLDKENFGLQSRLQLRSFLYKQKLASILKQDKKIGAFVGKFLPPHIGHLTVIDRALKECDEVVVVLSDDPKKSRQLCKEANFPYFSAQTRLGWLKQHYKDQKNIKFYRLNEGKLNPYTSQGYANLFWSTVKEKVNVKYGEEYYRKLNEESFPDCEFVAIDRNVIPISGTAIRQNPNNIKYMIKEGQNDVEQALQK